MSPTETVSTAVEKRDTGPGAMIEQYRSDFAAVLPSHIKAATWVRVAQGVLRRDKNLAQVAQRNPASLMQALLEAARLGHEPGTNAFYLVPFGNEVQGIEGYRGIVERIYRAGAVSSVKAEVVYAADRFEWRPNEMDKPLHEFDPFDDNRGEIRGAYAYCVMRDGSTSRVVTIGKNYIDKVKRESKGSDKPTSPWQKWPDAMVLKTVARRLEAWVPTSAEYMREQLRAIRAVQAEGPRPQLPPSGHVVPPGDVDLGTGEVIDGEIVTDPDGPTDDVIDEINAEAE